MKKLLIITMILGLFTTSCSINNDKGKASTNMKEYEMYKELDSTNLKLVVVEEYSITVINPETYLEEDSVDLLPMMLQIMLLLVLALVAFFIGLAIGTYT